MLQTSLGPGESEAITLALQEKASLILLDDRAALRKAESLGLKTLVTLGLFLVAKRKGLISAVKPLIEELGVHHFHVAPKLAQRIILDAGEMP